MKIVTAAEMRTIDRRTTEQHGVPSMTLMENAGSSVAAYVRDEYSAAKRIVVVCGKGNNGGDGFVAARHLHTAGKEVSVLLLASARDLKGDAAAMFTKLPIAALELHSPESVTAAIDQVPPPDLFLDALLGTGFKAPVSPLYAAAIRAMNQSRTPIVAVDVPSGADSDSLAPQFGHTILRAEAAVTFTAPKPVHVFGDVVRHRTVVAAIGSPDEIVQSQLGLNVATAADFADFLADRPLDSNKGMYGHALVFAGSFGKSGAAAMSGMACLRSGAGLVTIATPKSVLTSVASFAPELMTEPLPETDAGTISRAALDHFDELTKNIDVLALGPGLSQHEQTVEFVREVVQRSKLPIIVDADGLNALAGAPDVLKDAGAATILTPHPGEMARLCGKSTREVQSDRIGVARTFASTYNTIVVLKGYKTVIAAPSGETWINCTGNPGMATGGTGDVLTGILAGLLAQHPEQPLLCAVAAVHLHGMAGDIATTRVGQLSLVATDLIHDLPVAFEVAKQSLQKRWIPLQ